MSRFPDLAAHLKAHSLRTDGPFTLRSGQVSDWYLDGRRTTLDGAGARLVGTAIYECLDPSVEAVGGLTMGADPVALSAAMMAAEVGRPLRSFSVRKASKDHGISGRLVGPVAAGDVVAAVEDTTTTGAALMEAIEVARAEGLQVVQALTVCDRSEGVVEPKLALEGIPFVALLVPEDLGIS